MALVDVNEIVGQEGLKVTTVKIENESEKELKKWTNVIEYVVKYVYDLDKTENKEKFWEMVKNFYTPDHFRKTEQNDEKYNDGKPKYKKLGDTNLFFYNKYSVIAAIELFQSIEKAANLKIYLDTYLKWENLSDIIADDTQTPTNFKIFSEETDCSTWGDALKIFFTSNTVQDSINNEDLLNNFGTIFSKNKINEYYEQIYSDPIIYVNKNTKATDAIDCLKKNCEILNISKESIQIITTSNKTTKNKRSSNKTDVEKNNAEVNSDENVDDEESSRQFISNYSQTIYYGVPGSGKSHQIDKDCDTVDEKQKVRLVFHPDYCNADFIGQILPKRKKGSIAYEFTPGPFTRILWQAYHHPEDEYYLIIEEINRGNAAAIFGDLFQLLDRITSEKDISKASPEYDIGWSKYSVTNEYINNYLRSNREYGSESYTEDHHNDNVKINNKITLTSNTGIRLPPNLSILATMNTSDQNVFTLDNAFQRRWDMVLVSNKLKESDDQYKLNINCTLNKENCSWGKFREIANNYITDMNNSVSSMDDCQLGAYFITPKNSDAEVSAKDFACKVIKYLWDDVFRLDRESVFKNRGSFETAVIDKIKKENEKESLELSAVFQKNFLNSKTDVSDEEEQDENSEEKI